MHEALVKKLSELFKDCASKMDFTGLARGGYVKKTDALVINHPDECVTLPRIPPGYTVEEFAQACKRASQVGKISIKVNVNGSAKG